MIKANPKYKELYKTDKRYILVTGGRGSGKSFEVATFLSLLTYEENHRILFTRYTMTSANLSIIPEFIEKQFNTYDYTLMMRFMLIMVQLFLQAGTKHETMENFWEVIQEGTYEEVQMKLIQYSMNNKTFTIEPEEENEE